MNDQRLHDLVRMVSEIEELERSASSSASVGPASIEQGRPLRLVGREHVDRLRRHRRVWMARTVALATAAASLGLVVRMSLPPAQPSRTSGPSLADAGRAPNLPEERAVREVASVGDSAAEQPTGPSTAQLTPLPTTHTARPQTPQSAIDAPASGSVLLAIYEDAGGVVRCVRWREHDFGQRDLSKIRPGELAAATYGSQCVVGPHRLIAVGLSGPRDQLPLTDEGVQAMAQCIVGGQTSVCDIEPASYSNASISCLPCGLKVVVETLAMGRP
ncbi:MAG: hypothetical protein ACK4WH_02585 [Phycisphaerales bacterium]